MTTIRDYSARAFDAQAVASAPIGESDRIEICLLDDISRARRAFAASIVEKHGRGSAKLSLLAGRSFGHLHLSQSTRSSPHAAHLGG